MSISAYLFDLDGVLTPTALVHRAAWTETFNRFLANIDQADPPFAESDYLAFVDGKPRYDGVRSFLQSRGLKLPEGTASDSPGFETVQALGNLKNDSFRQVLDQEGIAPYPDAVALLDELDERKIPWAVVSSSANAFEVLESAGLKQRVEVLVDGVVAKANNLAGKPSPQTFLHAAETLGCEPHHCAVVEDAISGIEAGRAGGFGLVIGIARHDEAAALWEAGADRVVTNLAELVGEVV